MPPELKGLPLVTILLLTDFPSAYFYTLYIMEALVKAVFSGKWRSFKIFKHTGGIILNTEHHFKEFNFTEQGILTIKRYNGDLVEKIAQTDQWTVELKNKRHYLKILLYHLLYEVITINHTVLVLEDTISQDKVFLTKEAYWNTTLKTNTCYTM
jgi:hypothetical protein